MKVQVASLLLLFSVVLAGCDASSPSNTDGNADSSIVTDSNMLQDEMTEDTAGLDTSVIDTAESPRPTP
jgi:hypothetical protein